jgi:hypothetical protein
MGSGKGPMTPGRIVRAESEMRLGAKGRFKANEGSGIAGDHAWPARLKNAIEDAMGSGSEGHSNAATEIETSIFPISSH